MDFLSVPEYVIKKGRPHGHRYGKKPGDKQYHTVNQLKKRCKKKYFQGIHDPGFRNRMIENHRDEELCRRWDALADEDHTHHLTTQEYSLYKSNWWLHYTHKRPPTLTEINNGHRVLLLLLLLHGGIGKVHGGLLNLMKVTMEMNQVLTERGDLLNRIWNNSSGQDFLEFNYFVTDGSFTADSGLLQPTWCVTQHLK